MITSPLLGQHKLLKFLYHSAFSFPVYSKGLLSNCPHTLKGLFFSHSLRGLKKKHQPPKDHKNEWQYYFGSSSFKPGSHHPTQRAPQIQAEADSSIQEQAS